MRQQHQRTASQAPQLPSTEDFKVFQKHQFGKQGKENQDTHNPASFTKTVEDKLSQMQKHMIQDNSMNDQYLLSSMDQSIKQKTNTQLASISFNLQSMDAANNSQGDFRVEQKRYASNTRGSQVPPNDEQKRYAPTNTRSQPPNDNAVIGVLMLELERRFEYLDERMEKSEKLARQANQTSKYTQEALVQYQDKLSQLLQRVGKLEQQMRTMEEFFTQHRSQSDHKFVEQNKHVDQALKSFLNSTTSLHKKIDKLTDDQQKSISSNTDSMQIDIDDINKKLAVINKNLTNTHETLNEQVHDFTMMQKNIDNLNSFEGVAQFQEELSCLRERQIETLQYLQTFQENISSPYFG